MRSLSLRPGGSLTVPRTALSAGFKSLAFPPICCSSYRAAGFCPGGTDSHWKSQPSLDTQVDTFSLSGGAGQAEANGNQDR